MDAMLQKRCAKFIYVIPEGLRELMNDISREVIRSQPTQIYTFIADYLDALMITRENARVAARLVDSIIRIGTTTVELLLETGLTKQAADRMAAIIQNAFRQYMAAKKTEPPSVGVDVDDSIEGESDEGLGEEQEIVANIMEEYGDVIENEEAAARIIQDAFRMFKAKHDKEKEMLSGMIDWRVAARSAMYLYRKSGVTYEEANRAATLIKAAYKGYYTRRVMKRLLQEGRMFYADQYESVEFEEEEAEGESQRTVEWNDYLDLNESVDEETVAETTAGLTSDMAETLVDSVVTELPSESEPDQATATSWTEGVGADDTYADDMNMAEAIDYLRMAMDEEAFEGSTLGGIPTTGEHSSFEGGMMTEEMLEGQEAEMTPLDYDVPEAEEMEEQPIESVAVTEQGSMTESNVSPGLEAGE
ncbi:hypothetical protein QE152_g11007 [Popillia japonica]|uniref:RIIa domain-containing protein n=2 Tax=Popillia japonica TaxID=7064 RepID=A0AAW1LT02_POPJA